MALLHSAILAAPPPSPHVVLDGDVRWPVMDSPVLFVRPFYDAFYESVLGRAREGFIRPSQKRCRKVCVSGNPGIGKSSFGYYALFRALREGRTVVYQAEKLDAGRNAYLFRGEQVRLFDSRVDLELQDAATLFISDSVVPPVVNAFTLYITSPRRDRTWEFRKTDDAAVLYFPVLSWDETREMRSACFPDVSEASVVERYSRWGGIPRYVLSHVDEEGLLLADAIAGVKSSELQATGVEPAHGDASIGSHRVFHVKVHGEMGAELTTGDPAFYRLHSRELASKYVASALLLRRVDLLRDDMIRFVDAAAGEARLAATRGMVFEQLALERLSRGGRFPFRSLVEEGEARSGWLDLPPVQRRKFEALPADAATMAGEQLEPLSKSFCAIDVVLAGLRPANVTVSVAHPIKLRGVHGGGLADVASCLGLAEEVPFYWIVPPDVASAIVRPLPLHVASGGKPRAMSAAQRAGDGVVRRVQQYVLCVDVAEKAGAGSGGGPGLKRPRTEVPPSA